MLATTSADPSGASIRASSVAANTIRAPSSVSCRARIPGAPSSSSTSRPPTGPSASNVRGIFASTSRMRANRSVSPSPSSIGRSATGAEYDRKRRRPSADAQDGTGVGWKLERRAAVKDGAGRDAAETGEADLFEMSGPTDEALESDVELSWLVPRVDRHDEVRGSLSALEGHRRTRRAGQAKRRVAKTWLGAAQAQQRSH